MDRKTAESYVEILEDLLIGHRVQVFQKKSKRKMTVRTKFYYFDEDYPEAKSILLYGGDHNLKTDDGIEIYPVHNFLVEIQQILNSSLE